MKQKFYRLNNINDTGAQYQILLGERSNGKSFAVKEKMLSEAYHERDFFSNEKLQQYQFGYVRRWDADFTRGGFLDYFADYIEDDKGVKHLKEMTGGEYETVDYYRGRYYFANIDENGKTVKGKEIGYNFALSMSSRYKSRSYPKVSNIAYEEFITNDGYLPNEPAKLQDLVSTILRRRRGTVYMIGNTITRACPFFSEWGLVGTLKQKIGEIQIYDFLTEQQDENGDPVIIKIAVEICENSGNNSKMFFGQSSKMITSGGWQTEEQPHLLEPVEHYNYHAQFFVSFDGLTYRCRLLTDSQNNPFIYVEPHTTEVRPNERLITDKFSLNPNVSTGFLTTQYKYDIVTLRLLRDNKIVFSDNLTGTEFKSLIKTHLL